MRKPDDLKPCPFCGAGEYDERENTYWTGMASRLLSVEIIHWCAHINGMTRVAYIQCPGHTREEAVARWNHREAPDEVPR